MKTRKQYLCLVLLIASYGTVSLAADTIAPSKYSVNVLYGRGSAQVGCLKAYRCSTKDGRIWLQTFTIFGHNTDAYHEQVAKPVVVSDDYGLTWRLSGKPLPDLSPRTKTLRGEDQETTPRKLHDGTLLELAQLGWERHPRSKIALLRRQGLSVWDVGSSAGYCATIYAFWARYSRDQGRTWHTRPVHRQLPKFARLYAPYSPLVLADGSFVCFAYGSRQRDSRMSSYCLRTANGGNTWTITMIGDGRLSPAKDSTYRHIDSRAGFGEIRAIDLGEGKLLALLRTQLGMPSYLVTSADYGKTWSKPRWTPLVAKHVSPTKLPDGSILCTYQRRYSKPFGIRARITKDLGKTWGPEVIIRNNLHYGDGLSGPYTFVLADGSFFTPFFGYDLVGKRKVAFVGATRWSLSQRIEGESKWTRGFVWAPQIPVPPKRRKFNRSHQISPWSR